MMNEACGYNETRSSIRQDRESKQAFAKQRSQQTPTKIDGQVIPMNHNHNILAILLARVAMVPQTIRAFVLHGAQQRQKNAPIGRLLAVMLNVLSM